MSKPNGMHIGIDSPNLYAALGLTFAGGGYSPGPSTAAKQPAKPQSAPAKPVQKPVK